MRHPAVERSGCRSEIPGQAGLVFEQLIVALRVKAECVVGKVADTDAAVIRILVEGTGVSAADHICAVTVFENDKFLGCVKREIIGCDRAVPAGNVDILGIDVVYESHPVFAGISCEFDLYAGFAGTV